MIFKSLKQKMKSWHLLDLVRTVEQYPKLSHPRKTHALAEIERRSIAQKDLKDMANAHLQQQFRNLLDSRSYITQGIEIPDSFYLSEEEVSKLLKAEIDAYQERLGQINLNLGMYMA